MFRKTLIATAAVTAIMSTAPSVFAAPVANNDFGHGTITFHGSVTEAPCSIVPGDENLDINLGQVSQNMLGAADQGSAPVNVVIHLNSCQFEAHTTNAPNPDYGVMSKVDVEFANYNTTDESKGLLNNTGDATNVSVQLLDNGGHPMALSHIPDGTNAHQLTGTAGEMTFKARMLASGKATPGSVSAKVDYKLKYF